MKFHFGKENIDFTIMKKILSVMLLLFAVGANAQFTKVYEAPISGNYKIPWGKVLLNGAYDAEKLNDIYSPYHVYRSGDIVNVLNLETLEIEFKLDLTSVIDTSYYYTYVSFYKNLFKSDKSWSCFLMPYTTTSASFGLDVYYNGKLTKTDIYEENPTFCGSSGVDPRSLPIEQEHRVHGRRHRQTQCRRRERPLHPRGDVEPGCDERVCRQP
jgi:hypothetical protein